MKKTGFAVFLLLVGGCTGGSSKGSVVPDISVGTEAPSNELMQVWTLKTAAVTTDCPQEGDPNQILEQEVRFFLEDGKCRMSNLDADNKRLHYKTDIIFDVNDLACDAGGNVLTLVLNDAVTAKDLDCTQTLVVGNRLELKEGALTGTSGMEVIFSGTQCPKEAKGCTLSMGLSGVSGRQIVDGKEYGSLPPVVP